MEISSVWLPFIAAMAAMVTIFITVPLFRRRAPSIQEKTAALEAQTARLQALNERIEALEHGKAAESISEEILHRLSNRLAEVEQITQPLKGKPEFSSAEFNLLLHEIGRIEQGISFQQASLEGRISREFSSFRFRFTVGLTTMAVLFPVAIYFLTIRGA